MSMKRRGAVADLESTAKKNAFPKFTELLRNCFHIFSLMVLSAGESNNRQTEANT